MRHVKNGVPLHHRMKAQIGLDIEPDSVLSLGSAAVKANDVTHVGELRQGHETGVFTDTDYRRPRQMSGCARPAVANCRAPVQVQAAHRQPVGPGAEKGQTVSAGMHVKVEHRLHRDKGLLGNSGTGYHGLANKRTSLYSLFCWAARRRPSGGF